MSSSNSSIERESIACPPCVRANACSGFTDQELRRFNRIAWGKAVSVTETLDAFEKLPT
jgi:hypothetical protein